MGGMDLEDEWAAKKIKLKLTILIIFIDIRGKYGYCGAARIN